MNTELEELLNQIKAYRNDMVARNYPFQQISDIITKWEMKKVKTVSEESQDELEPIKDFLEEAEKEKKELEESYQESVRQTKERKEKERDISPLDSFSEDLQKSIKKSRRQTNS
tara:strand:- start:22 stop:363 length:342 start_codon:yes stop_codon:yes gene_type:complete